MNEHENIINEGLVKVGEELADVDASKALFTESIGIGVAEAVYMHEGEGDVTELCGLFMFNGRVAHPMREMAEDMSEEELAVILPSGVDEIPDTIDVSVPVVMSLQAMKDLAMRIPGVIADAEGVARGDVP